MKAAFVRRHGGPEVIELGELPLPEPGPDEALVKLEAAALNHLDVFVRRGLPNLKHTYPHVLGADGAGVVAKKGALVTHVKEGDAVVVHPGVSCLRCERCLSGWESLCPAYGILGEHRDGTYAEYVKVPGANLFAKPAALSYRDAAAVPLVFTTAWQMVVRRARVEPGTRVVIHAAGSGVSSAAIQIARLMGAEILATAGSDEKLALAQKLGAHHTLNYRTADFSNGVKAVFPRGADVIFDHVGKDLWEKNLRALRWGGEIVLCGATSGYEVPTDLRHVFFRQLRISGSTMGSKADFPAVLKALQSGHVKAVVDRVFPLREVREAHAYLERRGQFGKVVLDMNL